MEALDKLILEMSNTDLMLAGVFALLIAYVLAAHFMLVLANKRIQLEKERAEFYYGRFRHVIDYAQRVGLGEDYDEDEDYAADEGEEEDDEDDGPFGEGDDDDDFLEEAYELSEEEKDRRLAAVLASKRSQFTFDSDGTLVLQPGVSVTIRTNRAVRDDDDGDDYAD